MTAMYNICDLHYSMSSWCSNRGAPVQAAISDCICITVYVVFVLFAGSSMLDSELLRIVKFRIVEKIWNWCDMEWKTGGAVYKPNTVLKLCYLTQNSTVFIIY